SFLVVLPLQAAEYEVQKGDSLWEIAKDHDTSVSELKETNNLDSDIIVPNQLLKINEETTYTVQKGDTLIGIAKEFDVSVNDIKEWNDLPSNLIITGEMLLINEDAESNIEETQEVSKQEKQVEVTAETQVTKTNNVEPKAEEKKTSEKESSNNQSGETISVTSTAYTAKCDGCSGVTATGINLNENPNKKVIAVDPNVIPLGSRVHVEGYGEAIAGDTGGAIQGNKIDVHVPTKEEAYSWGVRTVNVTILD